MNIFTVVLIEPLANGLILFYKVLFQNMGLAIIGFSLFLRFILNPLTKPYMESMKKIKDIAPQLEKIKAKYKGDKIKFAQAQADFYKEKGINPGAGCLPYLLQIVVLIAFFNVFSRTLTPGGDIVANFNSLLYDFLKFKPGESINMSFLYLNISKPDIIPLPFASFSFPGPILFLSAAIQFLSAKVMNPYIKVEEKIAKKTETSSDDMQVTMQKSMTYTFPLFTLLIGMKFASGLALYWLVFSLTQIYQQVKSQGWGELTPLLKKLNLIK
jgi:YidC/Oxa1 family membrane protein insertase